MIKYIRISDGKTVYSWEELQEYIHNNESDCDNSVKDTEKDKQKHIKKFFEID